MPPLLPLREEVLRGDLRVLYLAWLRGLMQEYGVDEEAEEPPVPPGLNELTDPLEAWVDFLKLDRALLAAAAEASAPSDEIARQAAFHAWLTALPQAEKDTYLIRLVDGTAAAPELMARYRRTRARPETPEPSRRTVGELFKIAEGYRSVLRRQKAERRAAEAARREEEERVWKEIRIQTLLQLFVEDELTVWESIERHIVSLSNAGYDIAASRLADLKEVYHRLDREAEFDDALVVLREVHGRKRNFMTRLHENGVA